MCFNGRADSVAVSFPAPWAARHCPPALGDLSQIMNKWQIICPVVALVLAAIVFGTIHERGERRVLVSAVTRQVDGHASKIGELLITMRGSNVTVVEDAAFQELQAAPSTSLISRPMIRVAPAADGRFECVVDTSSLGIQPRTIRSSR